MYELFLKNIKLSLALGFAAIIAIVVIAYVLLGQKTGIPVTVYLLPQDATAVINGQTLTPGTINIPVGSYSVTVSKDGFTKITQTIEITEANNTIDIALQPESDAAKAWYQQHTNLYLAKEARTGSHVSQAGQQFAKENPIVSKLPIDNLVYTIGYQRASTDPNDNSIVVTVDAIQGYRNGAIQKIKDLGFNPADYIIEFRDYRNPFL